MAERGFQTKSYDTRIDRFRRRYNISPSLWAAEAGISRSLIARYRAATEEPYVETVAKLVLAARRITGQCVRAADLFDLGEDEPVNPEPTLRRRPARGGVREFYNTRFDSCLIREGVLPAHLARESGISRPTVLKKRTGEESFRVSVLATLVRALRRMGRNVRASDLANLGED
jgi:predicted transcriptional regulator